MSKDSQFDAMMVIEQVEQENADLAFIYDQLMNLGAQREIMRQMRETMDKINENIARIYGVKKTQELAPGTEPVLAEAGND